jgi:hypothetical protein
MPHPLAPTAEQETLRALRPLVLDVYELGDAETARRLPVIAYRVANTALDRKSERLLQNALDIWLMELALLPRATSDSVRGAVADLIAETAYYVGLALTSRMADEYAPMEDRLGVVPYLDRFASFEAEALKLHVDRRDQKAFQDAYSRWADIWFRHWSPQHTVDDLELFDRTGDREIARQLDAARRLVEAQTFALRNHSRALLELGAWVAYERRRDRMTSDDFSFFSRFLVGAVSSRSALVEEFASMGSDGWEASLFERWDMVSSEVRRPSAATVGWVAGRDMVRFWMTILLTRFMSDSADADHRPEGLPDWLVQEMRQHLQAIDEQWSTWSEVVEDRGKIERARQWLDEEERRGEEAGRARILEAPLDPHRIAEFVRAQHEGFLADALVREQIMLVGATRVEPETDLTRGLRRFPLRRDIFVEDGPLMLGISQIGPALAVEVDRAVYVALSEVASPAAQSVEPIDAVIEAASEMAQQGFAPDAVLAPLGAVMRPPIARHPRFRWRPRAIAQDRGPTGYVDELPVYECGPDTADQLIVVNFGKAVTLVERRMPSAEGPIQVSVSAYSEERAEGLVAEGFRFRDEPTWPPERVAEALVQNFVEVSVHFDYEVVLTDDAADAARRVYVATESFEDA